MPGRVRRTHLASRRTAKRPHALVFAVCRGDRGYVGFDIAGSLGYRLTTQWDKVDCKHCRRILKGGSK